MIAAASLNTGPLAVFAFASLLLGYGGIWALWHFVFSPKREHDDDIDRQRRDAASDRDGPGERVADRPRTGRGRG